MTTKPRIYKRSEWGARYANGFGKRPTPFITEEFLHNTVTPQPKGGTKASWKADVAAVRTLENIGQARFGKGISYSYIICPSGRIFEGVSWDRIGAHTGGHNTRGIGIALVGNYSKVKPTRQQLASIIKLRMWLKASGKMAKSSKLRGHRDVKATACPGAAAYKLIDDINLYTRTMSRGKSGKDVQHAQKRIVAHDYATWKNPRGIYGLGTYNAVRKIQSDRGWKVSGVIGANTYAWLIR